MFAIQKIVYNMERKMDIYKNKIALMLLLMLVLVFAVSSSGFADYYKYTDENGEVSYTDDLSKVPVDQRENIKTYESSDTVKGKTTTTQSKDKILYYDKETEYKIILRDGFLLGITKNAEGYDMYSEIGNFPEDYPKDLPEPGIHID